MPAIPLFGLGIAAKSPTVTAKLMTNFYAEQRPAGEKSVLVAHGTPGLELFADVEDIARGALEFEKNAVAFVVAGDTLWEVDQFGVKTNRGTLLTSSGRVSMAHNGVQIMMVDGFEGYIYNTTTLAFAQVTDPDFPAGPQTVCYLSRRFIINVLDSSRFYVSEIDDGLAWDALNFANAESNPDPIIAVWSSTGQLVLLGAVTTEFWGNSGTLDFPFALLQGTANEWGMDAVASIAKYDNTFAWLVRNRMGQVMVAQMAGYLPKKISTIDLDHIINAYTATEDAVAYSYMLGGHPMYVISFPSVEPAAPAPVGGDAAAPAVSGAPGVALLSAGPPEPRFSYDGDTAPVANGVIQLGIVDPETGNVWTSSPSHIDPTVETYVTDELAQSLATSISTPVPATVSIVAIVYVPVGATGREIWVMGWVWLAQDYAFIYNADTLALVGTVDLGYRGTERMENASYDPITQKVLTFNNGGAVYIVDPPTRTVAGFFYVAGGPSGTILFSSVIVTTDYLAVFTYGGADLLTLLHLGDYSVARTIDNPYAGLPYAGFAYDPERERLIHAQTTGSGAYNEIDLATGAITAYTVAPADDAEPGYTPYPVGVVYSPYNDRYMFVTNASPGSTGIAPTKTTLYTVNPDTHETESTYTYEDYDAAHAPLTLPPMLIPKNAPNYLLVFDSSPDRSDARIKRYYMGATDGGGGGGGGGGDGDGGDRGPGGIDGGPVDQTWLYDGSTGFWSKLKSFGIDRHRVQFSYQLAGQTIGADYANGKQYRITDTALSDNGEAIEGEIVGETLATPDEAFLTVNRLRVVMETGVGTTVGPGVNPQVSLSISRDNARTWGAEMWRTMGATGEYQTRVEWRRLGTTRWFTAKIRITDPVKRVITGASVNAED